MHGTGVPIWKARSVRYTGELIAFVHGKAIPELTTAEPPATEIENAIRHQPNAEHSDVELVGVEDADVFPDLTEHGRAKAEVHRLDMPVPSCIPVDRAIGP